MHYHLNVIPLGSGALDMQLFRDNGRVKLDDM